MKQSLHCKKQKDKMKKRIRNSMKSAFKPARNPVIRIAGKLAQRHYEQVVERIKGRGDGKIRVGAYVLFDSTFGFDGPLGLMLKEPDLWEVRIVIIPNLRSNIREAKKVYEKTREFFVGKYGLEFVEDGWDPKTNTFIDRLKEFDVVYYANCYDSLVHKYHSICYASTQNVLPIYVSYGYDVSSAYTLGRQQGTELNLCWKVFADTRFMLDDFKQNQILKGRNVVLAGYSKMDLLEKYEPTVNAKKRILITPHHTVNNDELPMSNFLEYSDLILNLPDMFPDAEFVFRPHPLLFSKLVREGFWTDDKVEDYISSLEKKGVEYSCGGDYFDLFASCDALINDCGSFTFEWLFTGKPGCFVYNRKLMPEMLTESMNECIGKHYVAHSEEEIKNFIKEVIGIANNQSHQMDSWVRNNIAINYPHVSEKIIEEINILK